ncbi:hypothetical protein Tco_0456068 [Tanacetum coccineum]
MVNILILPSTIAIHLLPLPPLSAAATSSTLSGQPSAYISLTELQLSPSKGTTASFHLLLFFPGLPAYPGPGAKKSNWMRAPAYLQ